MSDLKHIARVEVLADWLDYNGHMNDAAYALAFSRAIDQFVDGLGMGPEFREASKLTMYTLSMLIHYRREAKLGQQLDIFVQILDFDAKKIHLWLEMRRETKIVALSEQLFSCVDQSGETPRSAPFPADVEARISALAEAQSTLPKPELAGKGIAIKR